MRASNEIKPQGHYAKTTMNRLGITINLASKRDLDPHVLSS
jgi:hypothetical protein